MADPLSELVSALCPLAVRAALPGVEVVAAAVPLGLVVGLLAVCWWRPDWLLRLFLWLLTHSLYRIRVLGAGHVPARGGALLVCNSVGPVDWLLLLAAHGRRIRFLVLLAGQDRGRLSGLIRWAGAIAVEGPPELPALDEAFRKAGAALARGELVCLFTEAHLLADGSVLSFRHGYEQVARQTRCPVIPVSVAQAWGGLFGPPEGPLRWRRPLEIPYTVHVAYGRALPAATPAAEVVLAVQKLSADSAIEHNAGRRPVHRQFVRMAARSPFRPCFSDSSNPGKDLVYGKAFVAATCLAQVLRPMLGAAPMVGVWLPPSTGGALANLALALLGKTSVNLNYTSLPEGIQSALGQCGARHVLTSRRFTARLKLEPGPGVEVVYLEDLVPHIGRWQKLKALLAVILLPGWVLEHWVLRLGGHGMHDLATVIFSSGSTGEPKGVMLSHGNVAANVESMVQVTGLEAHDRALGVLPFFHSFGYTVALWAPLQVGASAVYHADPRQAREIGELCRSHHCTIYLSTATFLRFCLKKCEPGDFRTVRILMCGAEKLPQALAQEFRAKFGVLPLEGYGCTELSPAAAANMPDQEGEGLRLVGNRPGSVGRPLPGVAARVVHPETREPLAVGQEGVLLIHGANVMQGYLGRPDFTREVVRDGWYVTGDMARLDEDGFITLTGRLSRFAKVGGEMVPLEKIEEVLHEILGTSERVCAVTCVADEARGERLVVLYLAPQLAQQGLEVRPWWQQLNSRGLPNLWMPSERDFIPVLELPLLGSGKVNLKRVKELAAELARK